MFQDIGLTEILFIVLVVLLIFGAGKLPVIGRALGRAAREFRDASKGEPVVESKRTKSPTANNSPLRNINNEPLAEEKRSSARGAVNPAEIERITVSRSTEPEPTVPVQFIVTSPTINTASRHQTTITTSIKSKELAATHLASVRNGEIDSGNAQATCLKKLFRCFNRSH